MKFLTLNYIANIYAYAYVFTFVTNKTRQKLSLVLSSPNPLGRRVISSNCGAICDYSGQMVIGLPNLAGSTKSVVHRTCWLMI